MNAHPIFIMSSAMLYDSACVGAVSCWWLCWVWQIPLWYTTWRYPVSAVMGYYWGVLMLSGHLWGVMTGMWQLADGPALCRVIPLAVLIAVQSVWSALWFSGTEYVVRRFALRMHVLRYIIWWLCTTWLYIVWMDRYCLWMFGAVEGYCLCMPVLALAEHPYLLRLLPYMGMNGMLVLQLSVGAAVVWFVLERSWRSYSMLFVVLAPWILLWSVSPRQHRDPPAWVSYIGVIRSQFGFSEDAAESIKHFHQHCIDLCEQYPAIRCIVTPESTLYRTDMYDTWSSLVHKEQYVLLCGNAIRCVVGGFREESGLCYNTIWYSYRGNSIAHFDKQHALPLTERMPSIINIAIIRQLYFANCAEISCGKNKRVIWELLPDIFVVPYICSELFFAHAPDDPYVNTPILALCNSIWAPRLNALMLRGARCKAIAWRRTIIYISHGTSAVLTREGEVWPLCVESAWCRK